MNPKGPRKIDFGGLDENADIIKSSKEIADRRDIWESAPHRKAIVQQMAELNPESEQYKDTKEELTSIDVNIEDAITTYNDLWKNDAKRGELLAEYTAIKDQIEENDPVATAKFDEMQAQLDTIGVDLMKATELYEAAIVKATVAETQEEE